MTEQTEVEDSSRWGKFLRKHWPAFTAFIAAAILAFIGAVYVFVWFTGNAQSTGLVPTSLGMWTMGNIVIFILHALFWELVLIGIPVAIGLGSGGKDYRMLKRVISLGNGHAQAEREEQFRRCFSSLLPLKSMLTETGMLQSQLSPWTIS